MIYYLNIGTNLGDRHQNLLRAIAALSAGNGGCRVSDVVESEPWGFGSENTFLNVAVAIQSKMTPQEVLDWIHDIEKRLGSASHRDADGNYIDRLIDIDIMAAHDEQDNPITVNTPTLQIPHPHLYDRPFFYNLYNQLLCPVSQ